MIVQISLFRLSEKDMATVYTPRVGDWVFYDGHTGVVEVVSSRAAQIKLIYNNKVRSPLHSMLTRFDIGLGIEGVEEILRKKNVPSSFALFTNPEDKQYLFTRGHFTRWDLIDSQTLHVIRDSDFGREMIRALKALPKDYTFRQF